MGFRLDFKVSSLILALSPKPDNMNRKTILILGLALSLVISLLTLLFQQDLREKMGTSFYVVGLAIIGCILLVLAGYVWDRTMIERLRNLRESAGP